MANTPNPYSYVKSIYDNKGAWETASSAGDTKKANQIAADTTKYYDWLKNNGYTDIANDLSTSNYAQAKTINDKWAKMGKTPTRDYLYTLGQGYNMSKEDVDKLISWDDTTGEVSFGGKKIGTPDAVVDGVSYWSDPSVLGSAFSDYIGRSGTTRAKDVMVNQENENLFKYLKGEYDYLKDTNPFETPEGKAILDKYNLSAMAGRNNEVASGAGSNGGNIDSFAAANALRQQASLINQGQMVALDAHQQKLDHARNLLSDMGVHIDRVYAQDENTKAREFSQEQTAKNNDIDNKLKISSVTGLQPDEWVSSNNPYMNDDGTLKAEYLTPEFDNAGGFTAIMEKAKAAGNTAAYDAAAAARWYKVMGDYGKYGKWDDGNYVAPVSKQTQAGYEFDEKIKQGDRALIAEQEQQDKEAQLEKDLMDKKIAGEKEILAYKAYLESDKPKQLSDESVKTMKTVVGNINAKFKKHSQNPDGVDLIVDEGRGTFSLNLPAGTEKSWWKHPILYQVLANQSLTTEERQALISGLGFTPEDLREVYEMYGELK